MKDPIFNEHLMKQEMNCADRKENTSTQIACTNEIELDCDERMGAFGAEGQRSQCSGMRTYRK